MAISLGLICTYKQVECFGGGSTGPKRGFLFLGTLISSLGARGKGEFKFSKLTSTGLASTGLAFATLASTGFTFTKFAFKPSSLSKLSFALKAKLAWVFELAEQFGQSLLLPIKAPRNHLGLLKSYIPSECRPIAGSKGRVQRLQSCPGPALAGCVG